MLPTAFGERGAEAWAGDLAGEGGVEVAVSFAFALVAVKLLNALRLRTPLGERVREIVCKSLRLDGTDADGSVGSEGNAVEEE